MIARIVSIPLVAWIAYIVWQVFVLNDESYRIWLVPPVVILAALWVSSRELDRWFDTKKEKDLDEESGQWLQRFSRVYQNLPDEEKRAFRIRVQSIIDHTQFISMSGDKFPDDAGLALAHDQALLTRKKPMELVEAYVLYAHPFLTPNIPDKVHTCEYEEEDRVLIVSAEQFLPGFLAPDQYLNISMYAHAQALWKASPLKKEKNQLDIPDQTEMLEILGLNEKGVRSWLGLDQIDAAALSVCAYIYAPEKFSKSCPDLYSRYVNLI